MTESVPDLLPASVAADLLPAFVAGVEVDAVCFRCWRSKPLAKTCGHCFACAKPRGTCCPPMCFPANLAGLGLCFRCRLSIGDHAVLHVPYGADCTLPRFSAGVLLSGLALKYADEDDAEALKRPPGGNAVAWSRTVHTGQSVALVAFLLYWRTDG